MANEETSLVPRTDGSVSTTSTLDRVIDGAKNRLEYLRGKEGKVGGGLKWVLIGLGGLFFVKNIDKINAFVDSVVTLQEKLLYGVGLAAVGWVIWRVLSSKKFQYTVTMIIDRLILKFHKLMIARDKFGSAEFAISRLAKRKKEADNARANVYGVYTSVSKARDEAQGNAQQALTNAKGFDEELKRRASGGKSTIKMSDDGLAHAFNSSKSTLRINAEFYKRQAQQALILGRRCDILKEVSAATEEKLSEMMLQLTNAKKDWELALQTMRAMQASDDIVNSPDAHTYNEALDGIVKESEFFNGRVMMLMDRLDPTVQSYRMLQASNQLADEETYKSFLSDTKVTVKLDQQKQLNAVPASTLLADAESLLGTTLAKQPEPVPVSRATSSTSTTSKTGNDFDSLFRRK